MVGGNILVIDDEKIVRLTLKDILTLSGYNCFEAKDGLEGLNIIKQGGINLVITDIMMPNLRGDELFYEIKAKKEFKDLPIILMTGYTDSKTAVELIRFGAVSYIEKPFDADSIVKLVHDELASKESKEKEKKFKKLIPPSKEPKNLLAIVDAEEKYYFLKTKKWNYKHVNDELGALQYLSKNRVGVVFIDKKDKELSSKIAKTIHSFYPYTRIVYNNPSIKNISSQLTYIADYIDIKKFNPEIITENISICFDSFNKDLEELIKSAGNPNLWGVTGIRGSAKTTIIDGVVSALPYTSKFIRHNSRPPRPKERYGDDHVFVSKDYLIKNRDDFLVTFLNKGFSVGFKNDVIEQQLASGKDVLLTFANAEIIKEIQSVYSDMKTVFIDPCTNDPKIIAKRLKRREGMEINDGVINAITQDIELFENYKGVFDYTLFNPQQEDELSIMRILGYNAKTLSSIIQNERSKS